MNLTFNVCDIGDRYIRIQDITQQGDEYLPEDNQGIDRYFNFKYSETCTVNILRYNSTTDPYTSNIEYTTHDHYLDEAEIRINKDGYYTVYHLVLPTIDWLDKKLQDGEFNLDTYQAIYVTDGQKIYKYLNSKLIECEESEYTQVNTYNTTLSRCEKQFFHFYDLYNCFIKLSENVFNNSLSKCSDKNYNIKSDRYNRDFIWISINIMKLYVKNEQYEAAQLLLEKLDSCNGICKQKQNNVNTSSSCGCS